MEKRIFAVAAGVAAMVMSAAPAAFASQCTSSCDQVYMKCDKAGGKDCLPQWGQCKQKCTAPAAAAPASASAPANSKPAAKPRR